MEIKHVSGLISELPADLSPSKFTWILKCPLRGLYNNHKNKAYQPAINNFSSSLGNVVHGVLKEFNEGKIKSDVDFNRTWEKYEINQGNFELSQEVNNYGRFKYLTRKQVFKRYSSRLPANESSILSMIVEKSIHSIKLGIKGQPDLLAFINQTPYELKDYKTGEVFTETPENEYIVDEESFERLKDDYKNQLYIYGLLVKEKYGSYPRYLTIVTREGLEVSAKCEVTKIEALLAKILDLRQRFKIDDEAMLANPAMENCQYCIYKPSCTFKLLDNMAIFTDLEGTISDVTITKYGNFKLIMQSGSCFFYKIPFHDKEGDLKKLVGKPVFISNVKAETNVEHYYTPTKYTTIYVKGYL
jgi:hypothetical protein